MVWADNVTLELNLGFGFGPYAATPTFTDITTYLRAFTLRRGRPSIRREFDAGTLLLRLDNRDGRFDPNNTSSPYDPNLKLGTPVLIEATHNFITYELFRGHIDKWPLLYDHQDAIVLLECLENLAILRSDWLTAQAYSQERTDVRIGNILDDVGWPAGARLLNTGVTEVAAVTFTGTPLALIAQTLEAEQGNLYIAADGDITFKNRVAFSSAVSQATYDPGTNLDYEDIVRSYDKDVFYNKVSVIASTGDVQTASDATSITDHGASDASITDLPPTGVKTNVSLIGEPEALNVAEWIVGKHKDVIVRIMGFTVHPEKDQANLWPEVLGRELLEVVTVKFDPPGSGDTLNQEVAIQSIVHTVVPGSWVTTYTCYPLSAFETQDYWVMGTGLIGTSTVLA